MQQTNCNTHNKARIPATISQLVYDYCITTSLQQVHNRMILYGNQALLVPVLLVTLCLHAERSKFEGQIHSAGGRVSSKIGVKPQRQGLTISSLSSVFLFFLLSLFLLIFFRFEGASISEVSRIIINFNRYLIRWLFLTAHKVIWFSNNLKNICFCPHLPVLYEGCFFLCQIEKKYIKSLYMRKKMLRTFRLKFSVMGHLNKNLLWPGY